MTARGDGAATRQDGAREGATGRGGVGERLEAVRLLNNWVLSASNLDERQRRDDRTWRIMEELDTEQCVKCERVFDLTDEDDAEEWFYGHDCEATK